MKKVIGFISLLLSITLAMANPIDFDKAFKESAKIEKQIKKTSFPIKRIGEIPPLCLHCKQGRGRNQEERRKMSKLFGKLLIDALRRRRLFCCPDLKKT
jgi:hypothetical protein